MTVTESAATALPGGEASSSAQSPSLSKLLGLEVKHLLVGLDIAAGMLRRGEQDKAMRMYAALVFCEPTEIRFQVGLASCALEMKEYHLAMQAASAIVSFFPDNPVGYFISGRAAFGLRDLDAAIGDLREAVRLAEAAGDTAMQRDAASILERAVIAGEMRAQAAQ